MAEHTEGPWRLRCHWAMPDLPTEIVCADDVRIAKMCAAGPGRDGASYDYEKTVANARLIAAAPELLAACEAVMACETVNEAAFVDAQVRAAIAKATKEEADDA